MVHQVHYHLSRLIVGSQNGFDNSGRKGPINWGTGQTINYTQQAIQAIVRKYSVAPYAGTVVGIEVLNEPSGYVIGEYFVSHQPLPQTNYQALLLLRYRINSS